METNKQKPEPQILGNDSNVVDVHSIWQTIQGEGPYAGVTATFIRLAGCNLQCPFCDTDYTSQRSKQRIGEIVEQVDRVAIRSHRRPLVVLTGGEPFRQNIAPLVDRLMVDGYIVQIETNGTLAPLQMFAALPTIICSPKTQRTHPGIAPFISGWKYVIEAGRTDPIDGLPTSALGYEKRVARPIPTTNYADPYNIYIQPLDVGDEAENARHLAAAVEVCNHFGYRLCLQVHKIIGVK